MPNSNFIFSIFPNVRGFGYACIELPHKLIDFGIADCRPVSNDKLLKRAKEFLDSYRPRIVILRDCKSLGATVRSQKLLDDITGYAKLLRIPVYRYSRLQIRDVLEQFNLKTKYQIAAELVKQFPQLEKLMPKIRKPWLAEGYTMGAFDALSLIITHRYLNEQEQMDV